MSKIAAWIEIVLLALVVGCREEPQVREYRVPKPQQVAADNHVESTATENTTPSAAATDRMLAAIVPHGSQAWFFKLTGKIDSVAPLAGPFREFVKTVHFGEAADAPPEWTLPEGWQAQGPSAMRHATLVVPATGGPLELAVSSLPYQAANADEFVLSNVNRWRGQMGQPPIGPFILPKMTEKLELAAAKSTATLVDIEGSMSSRPMGGGLGGPVAAGAGPAIAPSPAEAGATSGLKFSAPAEWTATPASGFRKAAFEVVDGDARAEITIIDLAAAAGEHLPNVNRWRGQVGLGQIGEADLAAAGRPLEGVNWKGQLFELFADAGAANRQAILGTITIVGSQSWFIKLTGPVTLAEREKERFEAFCRSVEFPQ